MADIDTLPAVDDLPDVDGVVLGPETTISFTAPATIGDSGAGLAVFAVGDRLRIEGGDNHGQLVTVATVVAGTITTVEQTILTDAAGPAITLKATILNEGFEPGFENPNPSSPNTNANRGRR